MNLNALSLLALIADLYARLDEAQTQLAELKKGCKCNGSGVVLAEGPCDAAPVEVPCPCKFEGSE